ncbi:MAG: hypothetical protein GF418_07190 [Chitinivibrionales bacterium]|nr:hypothetical protein [Chitinivibrionales bacterium]MBD3395396.1 hypothetical protein [Chitinivibrionales bacterium]
MLKGLHYHHLLHMQPSMISIPTLRTYKLPLFVLLCFCFATAILGDSTAEALLLAHFGADMVPKMYLVNSLFLFLFSVFAMTVIDRVDRGSFFLFLVLGHGTILLAVWLAVTAGAAVLFIPLFSYAYVSKILLFLMFWTLANDLIDSRRAGTEFPFIAAGGTLGAISVSFAIPSLLKIISAQSLLPVWCVLSFVLAAIFLPVRKSFGSHFRSRSDREKHTARTLKSLVDDLRLVRREPLLWNMSVLYFLLFFILLNQHYEFYAAIKDRYAHADSLAAFLGYFNGASMGVTFVLQLTLAGFVLRKIGSTRSMFLLPAALCLVFGTLAVAGFSGAGGDLRGEILFWGIVAGVGVRIAFFDSFFSPNFQVFFSSLPQEIRGRGKLSIEGAIKPLAIAATSIWLMAIVPRMGPGFNMAVLFALAVVMIVQTFRLRHKYTESLTHYLSGVHARTLSRFMDTLQVGNQDNILTALSELLEKESHDIKSFIVEILADLNTAESLDILRRFLPRADNRTRSMITVALGKLKNQELKPVFSELLQDKDSRVVADAVVSLAQLEDIEVNEGLLAFLRHPNRRVKANTVIALWPVTDEIRRAELLMVLRDMLGGLDCLDRAAALYAIGELGAADIGQQMLEVFYAGSREHIVKDRHIWRQFLAALAKYPSTRSIEMLLGLAETTYAKRRMDIAASIGAALGNGYSQDAFLDMLENENDLRRHVLMRALFVSGAPLERDGERRLEKLAGREYRAARAAWDMYGTLAPRKADSRIELLMNAVREQSIDESVQCLIYMAALLDKTGQIRKVVGRIHHENRHVRARALEVLDNAGAMRINRWVTELLDHGHGSGKTRRAAAGQKLTDTGPVVASCAKSAYPWVRMCAEYVVMRG